MFDFAGTFAPIVAVNEVGVGLVVDTSLTYRGSSPSFVRATVGPMGFTTVSDGIRGYTAASVVGGLDHRLLELGLGAGLVHYPSGETRCDGDETCDEVERGVRAGIAASTRFGALDGLHFRLFSTLVWSEGRFRVGALDATLQVPLVAGVWLTVRGGTLRQESGPKYMGGAIRWLARGNGRSGSLFVTGGLEWVLTGFSLFHLYGSAEVVSGIAPTIGFEYRH